MTSMDAQNEKRSRVGEPESAEKEPNGKVKEDEETHVVVSPSSSPVPRDVDSQCSSDEVFVDAADKEDMTHEYGIGGEESAGFSTVVPSFLEVGLAKKLSPNAIKPWATLALTLDGRDKITKVLQYSTRLLGWYFASRNPHQSQRFLSLYKSLANSRKAFRLGRSVIEFDKLRSMGLFALIMWHMDKELGRGSETEDGDGAIAPKPKLHVQTMDSSAVADPGPSLYRSFSSMAYQNVYRPVLSRFTNALKEEPSVELWKVLGTSVKLLGLLGFWLGDNVNYLSSSGAFDDYTLSESSRLSRRKSIATRAAERGTQAYFLGCLAGLAVNWKSYRKFHKETIVPAKKMIQQIPPASTKEIDQAMKALKRHQEKQFSLFLALLKVRSDVHVVKVLLYLFKFDASTNQLLPLIELLRYSCI